MPTCVVPTCKNAAATAKKSHGITFHLFPVDEERKSQWTKIMQKVRLDEFWKPTKWSVICSSHFAEQYFYCTKSGLKRLKKEAFPNKNLAVAPAGMTETPAELSDLQKPRIPASTGSNSEIGDVNSLDLIPGNSNTSVGISGLSKTKTKKAEPQPGPSSAEDAPASDQIEEPYTEPEVKIENEEDPHVTIEIHDPLDQSYPAGSYRELFDSIADDDDEEKLVIDIPEPKPKPSQEEQKKKKKVVKQRKTPSVKCKKNLRSKDMELKAKDEEIARLKKSLKTTKDSLRKQLAKQKNQSSVIYELRSYRRTIENQKKTIDKLYDKFKKNERELNDLRKKFAPQMKNLDVECQEIFNQETQESEMDLAMQLADMIKELATHAMNAKRTTLSEEELAIQSIKQESDPLEKGDFAAQIANLMKDVTAFAVSTVNYTLGAFSETEIVREILVSLKQEFAKASSLMVQSDLVTQEERVVVKTEYTMDVEES